MVTSGLMVALVELIIYEDMKKEVLGVKFKDPREQGDGVVGLWGVVAVAYIDFFKRYCNEQNI